MSSTLLTQAESVIEWLQHNNGYWNSDLLEIKESKFGGVGVFAKQDLDPILKPIVLLRLHKQSVLSFQKSVIANLITDENIEGALALIISFIYEKQTDESSPWYPFIKSIDYKNSKRELILPPSLWSKKQKEILKGTELDIMGALDDQENQDAYETACTFALSQHEVSNGSIKIPWEFDIEGIEAEDVFQKYKTFVAISHAIASRDFEIDEYHQVGLVPGACLFNHSNKPTVRFESLFDVCGACGTSNGCDHIFESGDEGAEHDEDEELEQEGDEDEELKESADPEYEKHSHHHEHGEIDDCCGNDSSEDESEEEFDGPIEEFIEVLDAALDREREQESKEEEEEESSDSDLELEEEVIILDDEKPISPDDCCDITLMKKVKQGEELFNTYGDFSNSVLLSKYGFVIPENTNDTVGLGIQFLKLRKKNKNYSRQFDWWEKEGHLTMKDYLRSKKQHTHQDDGCNDGCCEEDHEDDEDEDIPDWTLDTAISYSGEPTPITYALLKLLSLNKLEVNKFLKNPNKINLDVLTTKSVSTLKIYKEVVEMRLAEYNTNIKLSKLLKSSNDKERLAAQLVSDEQSIIKRALGYVNKYI